MPIRLVHAYRDDGPMSVLTKWKPRKVECTKTAEHSDIPGEMFVVKYASSKEGSACAISELVCTQLLAGIGLRTLEPSIVRVSQGFAASCNFKSDFPYAIKEGDHYGTQLVTRVADGPPTALDDLNDPWQLVLLWVADTWIGNIDRERQGNTLLSLASGGRFHLIAADQSDCFGGTSNFVDGQFSARFAKQGKAPAPKPLVAAIAKSGGRSAVAEAVRRVRNATDQVSAALSSVPAQWWRESGISPGFVLSALMARAEGLDSIIKPSEWELSDGVLFL